jgi:hypothetical protein
VLLLLAGCDNAFDPKAPYTEQLVVYSILSTRSDTQYVRVYTTYNPSGFEPLENTLDTYVRNARVMITDASGAHLLRDTTIARVDRSRYSDDIPAYVAYTMRIQKGGAYSLSVVSDRGSASASLTVPGRGSIQPENPYVLLNPSLYPGDDIIATVHLSPLSRGYVARLFLDFDYIRDSVAAHARVEVPVSASEHADGSLTVTYPLLERRDLSRPSPIETFILRQGAYQTFLGYLQRTYNSVTLTRATFILIQVEENLYKYYNIANGFQDRYSIRTDLPDYSNIRGGLGVFGAMVEDSTVVNLRLSW